MFLLESEELSNHATNIINKDTQQHQLSLDLTVCEIHRFTGAGTLDFGGSEFRAAPAEQLLPDKRNPNDEYGWWSIGQGTYYAVFNEKLQYLEDTLVLISPHIHVRRSGIVANTCMITPDDYDGKLYMEFYVPQTGCNIKENARFASLSVLAG